MERQEFRFLVEMVENLGSYSVVYGTVDAVRVRARLTGRHRLREGTVHDFAVRRDNLYYFDRDSGRRIQP